MSKINRNIIIIISVILTTGLGVILGMLISGGFNKYVDDNPGSKGNNKSKTDLFSIDYILDFMQVYHLNTVETELKSINSMDKLSNQTKLWMAQKYLNNDETYNFEEGVSSKIFDKYISKVFGANVKAINENIVHDNKLIYEFNNGIYKKVSDYKENDFITTVIDQVIDYNAFNNKYEITFAKAYAWNSEVNSGSAKVYGSYEDALNHKNSIYEGNVQGNFENDNYDKLKKKLVKQKYTFANTLNNLIMINYEILD